ncbi:MAG TPA: ECF-type sigma factor [Bryobacteraceae bacterium]|nr:ECF-type sigma factor [Bryobacteraceae bacterium]
MAPQDLPPGELTRLLKAWSDGDTSALDRLTPIVYAELHRLARSNLTHEREGHLLQPSALINEAFVRLMNGAPVDWACRAHFFARFARLMREILIDFARAQQTEKRGSRALHIDLSQVDARAGAQPAPASFLDLDSAMQDLSQLNARQAQVVELRYFGGLENTEIAEVLGVSTPTVIRDWRFARAWLYSRLEPGLPATS